MNNFICSLLLSLFILPCVIDGQSSNLDPIVGPKNGSLLIAGGGRLGEDVILKFIEMAGGDDAQIVVIPTAGGNAEYTDASGDFLRRRGAKNVTVIHTTDAKVANTDAFIKPLIDAKGVWFTGGRQWRLVDVYGDTKSEEAFHNVLARGGAIGGSSAGATIQGSYLARGDTKNNQIMMGDHERGFGFMKNVAIDQHVLARNRHFDLFSVLKEKPELLGIGIDEKTAFLVTGDLLEVIGPSYALIYDGKFYSREGSGLKKLPAQNHLFYFLKEGDKYDLRTRKVINE